MRKEEQEDRHRRAGFVPELIFAWRVRRRDFFGRMTLAVAAAVLALVVLVSLVRIEGRPVQDVEAGRGAAGVMILRGDDDVSRDLIQWAREQSPDAMTWEPALGDVLAAVMLEVESDLRRASRYRPRLQAVPERALRVEPDPVSPLIALSLPPVDSSLVPPREAVDGAFPVRPEFTVSEELRERWLEPGGEWSEEVLRTLVSREAAYSLAVNGDGKVEFCLPLRGTGTSLDAMLQRRLRSHALKPDREAGLSWGTVTVRIAAGGGEEGRP
jgi:hypothetical protein